MKKEIYLSDLEAGERAKIKKILLSGAIKRRLYDLGLVEGTLVTCVLKSPGGGMKAFIIRGSIIAIRNEDSEKIIVGGENT